MGYRRDIQAHPLVSQCFWVVLRCRQINKHVKRLNYLGNKSIFQVHYPIIILDRLTYILPAFSILQVPLSVIGTFIRNDYKTLKILQIPLMNIPSESLSNLHNFKRLNVFRNLLVNSLYTITTFTTCIPACRQSLGLKKLLWNAMQINFLV